MAQGFWTTAALLGEFLFRLLLVAIMLIRQRGRGSSRVAWIVVILAVPLLGVLLYLLVGEVRLGQRRVRRHREMRDRIESQPTTPDQRASDAFRNLPASDQQIAALAEITGDARPCAGNRLRLIGDTDLFVQSLVEDIDAASDHCHLLFYIYLDDYSGERVAEALMRAAGRGVACRLLVDSVGSRTFLRSDLRRRMTAAGVCVIEALPARAMRMLLARIDLRNHRKIVVIDGTIAYMGSHNIADAEFAPKSRYAPWVDAGVRIEGPAARDLQIIFLEDWYLDTDESLERLLAIEPPRFEDGITAQVMATGPSSYNEAMRQLMMTSLHLAQEEIIITTPYLVPDDAMLVALCTTARRGVETSIVVPVRNDSRLVAAASRSFYQAMLDSGIQIHEYGGGLLHAKTLSIDRRLALLSSANFDRRSFELNFEISVVVYDGDFASQLRFLQRSYMAAATPVNAARWSRRHWGRRLWQNAAGTLGPLL